mmetsp:Transcript_44719/g.72796  ORF Transcript_44719/g.72796 Transcript_44719/m.72796 type:complete len:99 (+) Transcript_44719:62-358(+)
MEGRHVRGKSHGLQTKEEMANVVTHAVGIVFSIFALGLMCSRALASGDQVRLVSCVVYGFSMLFLYSASTFRRPSCKLLCFDWGAQSESGAQAIFAYS